MRDKAAFLPTGVAEVLMIARLPPSPFGILPSLLFLAIHHLIENGPMAMGSNYIDSSTRALH